MHEVSAAPSTKLSAELRIAPWKTRLIVVALLVMLAALMIASSRQESQTFDEADHINAGLEYWKHGDFGRNPEHPPLVKLLATIPLLPMGLKEPPAATIPYFKAQDFINSEHLLYTADADAILFRSRMVIALFTLVLGLLVFLAGREMFGELAGLFGLGIFAFEPVILSNGALVGTDMGVTCMFFASVYTFYRYVKRPTVARLALCAVMTGLAIVSKHSGLLVFPVLVLLACADLYSAPRQLSADVMPRPSERRARVGQLAVGLVAIAAVSYFIVWAIYGFRYAARPGHLQITPTLAQYVSNIPGAWKGTVILFFARHHLLPEAYLYGWVDILQISVERYSFILGRLYSEGQWFFFPAMFLIKTTLTLLVLLALAPFARIRGRKREFLFLTVPVAFFLLIAVLSKLNMGIRHILPIYPFCIVLAGAAAAWFAVRSLGGRVVVAALCVLTVVSSLHCFPDFLAFSNVVAGGPSRTYRLVTDSNDDWGQGLKWTRTYLDHHPTSNCWIDTMNPQVDPAYYGIECKPMFSGMDNVVGIPPETLSPATITGTVILSSTELSGLEWGPGSMNPYHAFRDRQPDALIGNVMLVYRGTFHIPELDALAKATEARSLAQEHRFPQALAMAESAAQEAPGSAQVEADLSQVLIASGQVSDGNQAKDMAIHLAETDHPAYQRNLLSALKGH